MKVTISTYWKCQLIGWGCVALVVYVVNLIISPDGSRYLQNAIITGLYAMLFSHFLRSIIKRLKIFDKSFVSQIVYLLLLNVVLVFIFIFPMIWIQDILNVLDKNQARRLPFFRLAVYLYYQALIMIMGWTAIYFLVHYIRKIRKVEQEKADLRIQLVESEAQALRAQMNPHFIFNCMNSIKSLMQENKIDKGVTYLTTFSKLIRTLFNNADKKEISLHDEIETCKLYLQLEAMRFDTKFSYHINIDEIIDLKSINVPALIIQPFIENAIWHGIVPGDTGGHVSLNITRKNKIIEIIIDDDGIGREASQLNKARTNIVHQSKGVNLTQSRLELNNLLQERQATLEILDKRGENGKASGTKVILNFSEEK